MDTNTTIGELTKNAYLLLTPGPLTTTPGVRAAMLRDWCTWDDDYNGLVQTLRADLVALAVKKESSRPRYTTVLMQGSGTFAVESTIGSVIPPAGKLLVLTNGAYGKRIVQIARKLDIDAAEICSGETTRPDLEKYARALAADRAVTHVAVVHCETTTGILNDIEAVGKIAKEHGKTYIVDAMSSFGGIPIDMEELGIDFLVSSANKCIHGVPGFGVILANRAALEKCAGYARSVSLDLYDQWATMEHKNGKWRFTSPTHVVRAFIQATRELQEEGGVEARFARYRANQRRLADGMEAIGFRPLLPRELQSPVITSFLYPAECRFSFDEMYDAVKKGGYVLYPGKISEAETFRIGNIGDVHPEDIDGLLATMGKFVKR